MHLSNTLALLAMATGLAMVVLLLFRLRFRLGLAPLYLTIGVFQHMQVMLANTFYIQILPGISVSPGSVVMFSLAFFAILLIYISDDASEARKLCYGVLAANIAMAGLSVLLSLIANRDGVTIFYNLPASFFSQDFRIMAAGTGALVLDIFLLILLYESSIKFFPNSLFLRIATSMTIVLAFDSLVFTTSAFLGQENFGSILLSGLVGKMGIALFYSLILTLYFHLLEPKCTEEFGSDADGAREWKDVFHLLTFRQKYGVLKDLNAELRESKSQLETALADVKLLQGLLPICGFCKDVRDDAGYWKRIETFIHDHSDAKFSHGVCPKCAEREYPEHFAAMDFRGQVSS